MQFKKGDYVLISKNKEEDLHGWNEGEVGLILNETFFGDSSRYYMQVIHSNNKIYVDRAFWIEKKVKMKKLSKKDSVLYKL